MHKMGDYAYINKGKLSRKLMAPHEGPYRINETNQTTNGTWFKCKEVQLKKQSTLGA